MGANVSATPALAGGVLYVPTADGDLVAVDAAGCGAATCEPLWSAAIDGTAITEQPAVSGDGDGRRRVRRHVGRHRGRGRGRRLRLRHMRRPAVAASVGAAVTGRRR